VSDVGGAGVVLDGRGAASAGGYARCRPAGGVAIRTGGGRPLRCGCGQFGEWADASTFCSRICRAASSGRPGFLGVLCLAASACRRGLGRMWSVSRPLTATREGLWLARVGGAVARGRTMAPFCCRTGIAAAKEGALMTRRIGPPCRRSWSLAAIGMATAALAAILLLATPGTGLAAAPGPAAASAIQAFGELDCNGYSPVQRPVKPGGTLCAEVHGASPSGQLYDNGWYIGHDEPTIQFYSRRPGSSTVLRGCRHCRGIPVRCRRSMGLDAT
jgi:hypothetical protein